MVISSSRSGGGFFSTPASVLITDSIRGSLVALLLCTGRAMFPLGRANHRWLLQQPTVAFVLRLPSWSAWSLPLQRPCTNDWTQQRRRAAHASLLMLTKGTLDDQRCRRKVLHGCVKWFALRAMLCGLCEYQKCIQAWVTFAPNLHFFASSCIAAPVSSASISSSLLHGWPVVRDSRLRRPSNRGPQEAFRLALKCFVRCRDAGSIAGQES